jgi:hypothetical protein
MQLRVQHMRCRSSSGSTRSPYNLRDQVKVLEIQSSPRGESSDSITLTRSFITFYEHRILEGVGHCPLAGC